MQAGVAHNACTLVQPGLRYLIAPQSYAGDAGAHAAVDRFAHAPLLRRDLIEAEPGNISKRFHTLPPGRYRPPREPGAYVLSPVRDP